MRIVGGGVDGGDEEVFTSTAFTGALGGMLSGTLGGALGRIAGGVALAAITSPTVAFVALSVSDTLPEAFARPSVPFAMAFAMVSTSAAARVFEKTR